MLSKGANPNVTNNKLDVPLHTASYYGYTNFARLLLEHGADPNAKTIEGNTPLMVATHKEQYEIAELLIENKANIDEHENLGGHGRVG